jgi:hypothetical protein
MQRPIVTVAQDGNHWNTIQSEITSNFPLVNVNFTNPTRGSDSRCITSLDFEFKQYHPDMFPKFVPGALQYNSYFVHLFLLSSDDVDLYKNSTKKLMQEWWNVVANKKNQVDCINSGLDYSLYIGRSTEQVASV